MNASRRLAGPLLLLGAAVALGYLLIVATRARSLTQKLADADEQRNALRREVAKLDSRTSDSARQTLTASISSNDRATVTPAENAAGSRAAAPAQTAADGNYRLIASHPKLRELYLRKFEFDDGGPRLAALRLNEEQLKRIRTAAVERESARLDLRAAAEAQGLGIDNPGIKKLAADIMRDYERKFEAAVGPANAAQYRAAMATAEPVQQPLADWLAARAIFAGATITLEQGRTLARILSEDTPPGSLQPQGGYWHRAHRVDWDAAMPKIAAAGFPGPLLDAIRPIIEENRLSMIQNEMIESVTRRFPAIDAAMRKSLARDIGYYNPPVLPPRR